MVETAAGLAAFPAHIPAAEYHSHPLWPRYVTILQFISDVLKAEEMFRVPKEA